MQLEGIHIDMRQCRQDMISASVIAQLKQSPYSSTKIYASHVGLVADLENASSAQIDYCYGGLMMSPISRHQMLQVNDSRIAKAIYSLHPHPQPNQNGDK